MSYFEVILEGKNFFLEIEGNEELLGFVTTRWVEASNPQDAEFKARELIKNDDSLLELFKTSNKKNPKPMIYLSEIAQVSWFTFIWRKPGCGYSFYPMKEF